MICTLNSLQKLLHEKRILVTYHDPCMDGSLAAAVFMNWVKVTQPINKITATYVKHYHSLKWSHEWKDIDMSCIDTVLFLDVCPTYEEATEICKTHHVLIVDHHEGMKSDIDKMIHDNLDVTVVYSTNDSGASLTWVITHEDTYTEEWTKERYDACPIVVRIVRARDMWRYNEDPGLGDVRGIAETLYATTIPTIENLLSKYYEPEQKLMKTLATGANIIKELDHVFCTNIANNFRRTTFKKEVGIEGELVVGVCNCPPFKTSIVSDWLSNNKFDDCDIYVLWSKNESDGKYSASLRRPSKSTIDLSVIAKQIAKTYNCSGGGHTYGAGVRFEPGMTLDDILV